MVLSPDPKTYVHPASLTRRNVPYGPHSDHRLNVYRNATRATAGNVVVIKTHGGGWGAKDKTTTVEGTALVGGAEKYLWAYLLDNTYGTTTTPVDIVSIEVRGGSHGSYNPVSTGDDYEPTYEGTNPGNGTMQYPAYGASSNDDLARAVQWVKDNRARFGWSGQVVLWGESAGATQALVVAFSHSRHFTTPAKKQSRWDACSSSSVLGVLNYYGAVNLSPWFTNFYTIGGLLGFQTDLSIALGIKTREDMERALLIPDSAGAFPSTCERSPLCKSLSPIDVIPASHVEWRGTKVRSIYLASDASVGTVPTYSTTPPYANPHDPVQRGLLDDALEAADVTYESVEIATGSQANWEATLADTYTWLADLAA